MLVYHTRIVDTEIDRLVEGGIAAISIEGAKATGKSLTATQRVATSLLLERTQDRQVIEADPDRILNSLPVLVDEWQHVPSTWGVVRAAVNEGAAPGSFFFTGSKSAHQPGTHSGAGRIVSVRMRPMTLVERGVTTPTVSLSNLLTGSRLPLAGHSSMTLDDYVHEIVASGFPGIRHLGEYARCAQLEGYLERALDHDFRDLTGRNLRNPLMLRRWLASYAAATSTVASFESIRDASTGGMGDKPTRVTTMPYRDALESLFILDPVPAWIPSKNHMKELGSSAKHHLVDPALVTTVLGLDAGALLDGHSSNELIPRDGTLLGALFESLVTLNIRVMAQAAGARVGHLRTHRGQHEIDLIVERRDRRVVAIEVKLSGDVTDDDVHHLHWLRDKIGSDLLDAAVITTGREAYRRADGIAVIPAGSLDV
jgi:predicted AAA+ superfamily ATPase